MTPLRLDPLEYYRLPWSLTDNGISWLEVTNKCNLACKGCYRDKKGGGHKTLDQIADDLSVFKRERKSDCISIAGGDPLVHPQVVDIVRMIRTGGWKPIVNTNGIALTPELLHDLKRAGVFGFTFHIDTSQKRADAKGESEADHNAVRQRYAEMLAREGAISCSFNQTVNQHTIKDIPEVIRWAQKHSDIVHTVVFILFREPGLMPGYDFFANGRKIDVQSTYEDTGWGGDRVIKAQDVASAIHSVDPMYRPAAYLNGTVEPKSMKWLVGIRIGTNERSYGYVTPKFAEIVQQASYLFRGRWLSYSSVRLLGTGRLSAFLFGLWDKGMRAIAWNMIRRPSALFRKSYLQSYMIIQPVDFAADGRMNMCDGCPDMTVHEGKLYWSCRLEEIKRYGCFLTAAPKPAVKVNSARTPA